MSAQQHESALAGRRLSWTFADLGFLNWQSDADE